MSISREWFASKLFDRKACSLAGAGETELDIVQHVNKSEREAKLFQTTIHQILVEAADGLVEANFAVAEAETDFVVAVAVRAVN